MSVLISPPPFPPVDTPVAVVPPPPSIDGRDAQGRFLPGHNAASRPPGVPNRATVMLRELFESGVLEIGQAVLTAVRRGDMMAARIALDRAAPVRRGTPITIPDFPKVETIADVPKANAALIAAVSAGLVTPEEAAAVATVLEKFVQAVETVDLAAEIAEIRRLQDNARAP